jgi:drug/metabolite transporter (DMT)-like permease
MWWHLLALTVSCIWGSTFASSSVLIKAGLSPAEIMCLRFLFAYLLLLPFCRQRIIPKSWRDELLFVCLGITGGSLYFLTENYAIKLTTFTSTVALIVCTTPILTAILNRLFWRSEPLTNRFFCGSFIALSGVSMVVLNGVFVLDDNPWVILLSFLAALCWAFYSIILKVLEHRYSTSVITRKTFFWGVITMIPAVILLASHGESQLIVSSGSMSSIGFNAALLLENRIFANLLFLSLIASLGCFFAWNVVCKRISIVSASNYLYFNPIVSLLVGAVFLNEKLTLMAVAGCLLTIAGVYLCNRR